MKKKKNTAVSSEGPNRQECSLLVAFINKIKCDDQMIENKRCVLEMQYPGRIYTSRGNGGTTEGGRAPQLGRDSDFQIHFFFFSKSSDFNIMISFYARRLLVELTSLSPVVPRAVNFSSARYLHIIIWTLVDDLWFGFVHACVCTVLTSIPSVWERKA